MSTANKSRSIISKSHEGAGCDRLSGVCWGGSGMLELDESDSLCPVMLGEPQAAANCWLHQQTYHMLESGFDAQTNQEPGWPFGMQPSLARRGPPHRKDFSAQQWLTGHPP